MFCECFVSVRTSGYDDEVQLGVDTDNEPDTASNVHNTG